MRGMWILTVLALAGCHPPMETKARHFVHSGEPAILTVEGQQRAFMALAKEDAHLLAKAVDQKDAAGTRAMVKNGKALELENGTAVKVLSESYNERKIEVTDGPERGRTGWVPFEWLKPPQPKKLG